MRRAFTTALGQERLEVAASIGPEHDCLAVNQGALLRKTSNRLGEASLRSLADRFAARGLPGG
jgi:hypothetical protein